MFRRVQAQGNSLPIRYLRNIIIFFSPQAASESPSLNLEANFHPKIALRFLVLGFSCIFCCAAVKTLARHNFDTAMLSNEKFVREKESEARVGGTKNTQKSEGVLQRSECVCTYRWVKICIFYCVLLVRFCCQ